MADSDPKIAEFHAIKPGNYGFLREWRLVRSSNPEDQDGAKLTLLLQSQKPDESTITIQCEYAIEVQINSLNESKDYLIDIKPIEDKRFEDGNYYVSEINHKAFSFVCKEFSVRRSGYKGDKNAISDRIYCSFCGKSQREVQKLIAGPHVCICNECVSFCVGILIGPESKND